jgi:transposase
MLADQLDYVVGVDPHRDSHALAVVQVVSGAVVFEATVVASSDGYAQALKLADQQAPGRRAFAVEGTGSFGAGLTRFLTARGERVLEVSRLRRERRSGGKTDALDAVRAARSLLTSKRPATPRAGGERQALQALVAAREGAVNAKRAGLCQLRDLLEPARFSVYRWVVRCCRGCGLRSGCVGLPSLASSCNRCATSFWRA